MRGVRILLSSNDLNPDSNKTWTESGLVSISRERQFKQR